MSQFDNPTERVIPVDHVVGGGDPDESGSRRLGRLIVGVLGGVAIGLLLATGAQQSSPDSETTPSTLPEVAAPPTVPTTTTTLAPSRLDILVDGYDGTLILAGAVNRQGRIWRWESRTGNPLPLDMPEAIIRSSFNSSQVRVAATTVTSVSPSLVLWVGTPGNLEPLAVDVVDYRWHQSDPSRIAWIEDPATDEPDSLLLRTAVLPAGSEIGVPISQIGRLVSYHFTGVVMQIVSDEEGYVLVFVDFGGEEAGRVQGRYLGALPNGRTLISQNSKLVSVAFDLSDPQPIEFPSEKRMAAVQASPSNQRWAIWEIEETTGFAAPAQLWILDGEEIVFEATLPSAIRAVSWSHDGRWLIAAVGEPSPLSGFSSADLWFVDTTDWSMHQVAAPGFVWDIAAVP